jgi:hypothetical protein
MKKIKLFAVSSRIQGRKSSGREDYSTYKNWRSQASTNSTN